jgi:hypothetical protein
MPFHGSLSLLVDLFQQAGKADQESTGVPRGNRSLYRPETQALENTLCDGAEHADAYDHGTYREMAKLPM